jgi:amino-acid N-acetyltransferase
VVETARVGDADAIAGLLEAQAPATLPVPAHQILRRIRRYRVIRQDGRLVACAALMPLGSDRYEMRSVAVDPDTGGQGLGTRLVSALQREASFRGRRLVCVTLQPGFFERLGFEAVPLDEIPPKAARADHPVDQPRVAMEWRQHRHASDWWSSLWPVARSLQVAIR